MNLVIAYQPVRVNNATTQCFTATREKNCRAFVPLVTPGLVLVRQTRGKCTCGSGGSARGALTMVTQMPQLSFVNFRVMLKRCWRGKSPSVVCSNQNIKQDDAKRRETTLVRAAVCLVVLNQKYSRDTHQSSAVPSRRSGRCHGEGRARGLRPQSASAKAQRYRRCCSRGRRE